MKLTGAGQSPEGLGRDNFVLFGHSWDGILAIEYALKVSAAPAGPGDLQHDAQRALTDLLDQLADERGGLDTPEDQAEIARYMRLLGGMAEEPGQRQAG